MTDDIEELKKMHDALTSKLMYFQSKGEDGMIKALEKNIKKVSERIQEIQNKD